MCFSFRVLIIIVSVWQVGCATYQTKVSEARRNLESGNPELAIQKLEPLAAQEGKDQLIYLLDYAVAKQVARDYKGSSQALIEADRLAESKDYISVTKQTASLLLSQEMVQYGGEDFEKLLINAMGAINFALMNDLESARVETKRLTEKLEYFRGEKKQQYKDNSLAFWLNGHIWEANRDWDSALIDFEKAYKTGLNNELIQNDLIRAAHRARRPDKVARYTKKFGIRPNAKYRNNNYGEVVVLYQSGWGPRKRPNPEAPRFPILVPERSWTKQALVKVNGVEQDKTELVYDLESASIEALNQQYGALVAKRIAGMLAKEAVRHEVQKKNEGFGLLLGIAMHASDRADLRQWSTLPKNIQAAHLFLPKGTHKIQLIGLSGDGAPTGEASKELTVEVRPRKKSFIGWRSFR